LEAGIELTVMVTPLLVSDRQNLDILGEVPEIGFLIFHERYLLH
jgi:hypothetical protein